MTSLDRYFSPSFCRALLLAGLIHLIVFNLFVFRTPSLKSISNPRFIYLGGVESFGSFGSDPVTVFEKFTIRKFGTNIISNSNLQPSIILDKPSREIQNSNPKKTNKTLFVKDELVGDEVDKSTPEIEDESTYQPLRLPGDDIH